MNPTLPQVNAAMQDILTTVALDAGLASGFVRRPQRARCTGAVLAQTMALTLLTNPTPSLEDFAQTARALGVPISPQGLDQRLTAAAATCLQQIVAHALQRVVAGPAVALPLLRRFPAGVILHDSSTIALPPAMASTWPGCGAYAGGGAAALKLQLQLDVLHGRLTGTIHAGRIGDRLASCVAATPAQALVIADLGYWSVPAFAAVAAAGGWWLSRLYPTTRVQTTERSWYEIADLLATATTPTIDIPVQLTRRHELPARLIAVRVPQGVADQRRRRLRETARRKGRAACAASMALADWTVIVTNLPPELVTVAEALVLLRLRWQIELVFKLWKSHGQIDLLRPVQPWRLMCELYGRILAMVIQHWLLIAGCWRNPDRSFPKAAHVIRACAGVLAPLFSHPARFLDGLAIVVDGAMMAGRVRRRAARPSTVQLLLDPISP